MSNIIVHFLGGSFSPIFWSWNTLLFIGVSVKCQTLRWLCNCIMIIMSASGHLTHTSKPQKCVSPKLLQGDHPAPARLDFCLDRKKSIRKNSVLGTPSKLSSPQKFNNQLCFTPESCDGWKTPTFFHFWGAFLVKPCVKTIQESLNERPISIWIRIPKMLWSCLNRFRLLWKR